MTQESAEQVEAKVSAYIQRDAYLTGLGAQVLPGTARQDQWGWSIVVGTVDEPERKFEFFDHLTEVEEQLNNRICCA